MVHCTPLSPSATFLLEGTQVSVLLSFSTLLGQMAVDVSYVGLVTQ